jgi:tRNA-specific 2-thiouridylase
MNTKTRIAVGMSGGVDSSVAAALLVDQGYEVIGLTAHMWKDGSRCCSIEDVDRARKISWHLGIEHFVLNAYDIFSKEVVAPFVSEYSAGRTPSPCVTCNKKVKFGFLLTRAVQMKCAALATGHYAKVEHHHDAYHLLKAKDTSRDQSYFLHRLDQRQLEHVMFPLADMLKATDIKDYVTKRKLPATSRGESVDLCFVPAGEYASFVEKHSDAPPQSGPIVDSSGIQLGTHKGLHNYTVGQRKGLGLAVGSPLYVTSMDRASNTLFVGTMDEAQGVSCTLTDLHWIADRAPDLSRTYSVRIRYQHDEAVAHITLRDNRSADVLFEQPQFAISPGQAAVIYDDEEVLGGGWIK